MTATIRTADTTLVTFRCPTCLLSIQVIASTSHVSHGCPANRRKTTTFRKEEK